MRSGADIVGDVEQRRDEELVGGGAFGLDRLARAAGGSRFGTKPPLAPTGTMTAFLTFCALTRPRISVRKSCGRSDQRMPPRATLPKRRCTAFDPRRIDEDLAERPRQRHAVELAAGELDGDEVLRLAVAAELIEIGADRRLHRVDETAEDAVLVEAVDRLQARFRSPERCRPRAPLRSVRAAPRCGSNRVWNKRHDLRRDGGMLAQRRPHVILRVGHADLAQKARQRADQRDVAPDQSGGEHQRVIAVVLGASAHDREETGSRAAP